MSDFDKIFENFLESQEYDKAEDALFSIARAAYKAGWLAAGGNLAEMQNKQNVFTLSHLSKNKHYLSRNRLKKHLK